MKSGTNDATKGKFYEVKGKLKEKVGKVINDPGLEAEGKSKNLAGRVQRKIGQIKDVFKKKTEAGDLGYCHISQRCPCTWAAVSVRAGAPEHLRRLIEKEHSGNGLGHSARRLWSGTAGRIAA